MLVRSDSTVVGDSATSAVWTLVSRVTGFGRVLLIGAVLGPSYFGNLFQLANQTPWIVFDLAVGALLGALLVPELVRHISANDTAMTERIAGGFLGIVLSGFTLLAIMIVLFSGQIAALFALPISDPVTKELFISTARPLLWLTAPQLVGYGIAMTGQAVQHATGHYRLPAAASILENVTVIATLLTFGVVFGSGVDLADLKGGEVALLGTGATAGVAFHAIAQMIGARRVGIRLRPRWGWTDPMVRSILRSAIPTSGTAVLNGARLLIMMVAANTVAGGVVAFQLALNVVNLPVALASKPVAYALLPRLSRFHQHDETAGFSDAYRRGVGLSALITIPAAAAAASVGWFAAGAVAIGEMDSAEGRNLLALVLVGVAGAILGEGLQQLATTASYAQGDAVSPFQSLIIRVLITSMGTALSIVVLSGPVKILGIALSMSIADMLSSGFLHRRLASDIGSGGYELSLSVMRTAAASIVAFGAAGIVAYALSTVAATQPPTQRAIAIVFVLAPAMAAFVALRSRMDGELAQLVTQFRGAGDPS